MRCSYTKEASIHETDEIKRERIRAKTQKEIELGKKEIEKETVTEIQRYELERKKIPLLWAKIICYSLIIIFVIGLCFICGYKISHRNDIQIPLAASAYCNRDFQDTKRLLTEAGFENIELIAIKDLLKSELDIDGKVSQISINGITSFHENEWFPKDSTITVTYHVLNPDKINDIEIPLSAAQCTGDNYQNVIDIFKSSGFTDIETKVLEDLNKDQMMDDGIVNQISINNDIDFHQGDWVAKDSKIVISYHTIAPERKTDISVPIGSEQYSGQDYLEIISTFENAGFQNIILIPKYDLKFYEGSKNGEVQSVFLNGDSVFVSGKWVPNDSIVTIIFNAKEIKYEGEDYQDVENKLAEMGLKNIQSYPMDDLNMKHLKDEGKVDSILINGIEFSDAESFDIHAETIINYHSKKMLTNNRIEIEMASKELCDGNYQTAVNELEKMGFTNIKTEPMADLHMGWLNKEGEVAEISIDGETSFVVGDIFDKASSIIIKYHSFKKE